MPADRLDLCVRVFCVKRRALKSVFIQEERFSTFEAYVCKEKFLKGGFYHAHRTFFLDDTLKYGRQSPGREDRLISAETPAQLDAHLQKLVIRSMTHKLCEERTTFTLCMGTSACKRRDIQNPSGPTGATLITTAKALIAARLQKTEDYIPKTK